MNREEYIEYLQSFDDKSLNEKIILFRNNVIDFSDVENYAVDNMFLSEYNYFKTIKIGKILKG